MQKLEELIAALEKADGPIRELDCAIAVAIDGYYEIAPKCEGGPIGYGYVEDGGKRYVQPGQGGDQLVRSYTASIDAALGLLERVLPGWRIENLSEWDAEILRDQGPWMCDLVERRLEFFDRKSAKCSHAPTAALALCIATLRALSPKEQS
jgi:hypothetical protein